MTSVLLIQPPPLKKNMRFAASKAPPISLMYIAQYLIIHDYEVEIWDMETRPLSKIIFLQELKRLKPKIVGITVNTLHYFSALAIASAIKEWNQETIIVFGGPHVTFEDREALQTGNVDFIVRNEGEITMLELAESIIRNKGRKFEDISGITYKVVKNGSPEIMKNSDRPFIENINMLPFPYRFINEAEHYLYPGAVSSSRGCINMCIFCVAGALTGGKYRVRDYRNVIAEMNYLYYVKGYNIISFIDDTVTAIPHRLKKICHELIKEEFNGSWVCESRVDVMTEEILGLMAQAGCRIIQFGLESGDQNVLSAINKRITLEQIENAVRWAVKAGIIVRCSYIIGHHIDTNNSIKKTLDFTDRLFEKYGVICGAPTINTPFPGTYLREHARELNVKILHNDWSEYAPDRCVMEIPNIPVSKIREWHYIAMEKWNYQKQKEKANSILRMARERM